MPPQFYAADIDARSLTLSPGQVAAMPLPFLPRFPPRWESATNALPSHLNVWQRADREEWLGPYALRSNLHLAKVGASPTLEEYSITSTLLVESETHGIESVSVKANSVRDNPFGLPDIIYFHEDLDQNWTDQTSPASEAPKFLSEAGIRILDRIWNVYDKSLSAKSSDCYDVYIRHPGKGGGLDPKEPWLIHSIAVSNPERVSLYLSSDCLGCLGNFTESTKQVIETWGENTHRVIPPDGEPHYLVSVCPTPAQEKDRRTEEKIKKSFDHWITSTQSEDSLGFVIIQSDAPVLMTELIEKRANGTDYAAESAFLKSDLPTHNETRRETPPVFRSPMEKIDMYYLPSTGTATRSVNVSIHNTATRNVTIMSASLVFRDNSANKMNKMGVRLNLHPILSRKSWNIGGEQTQEVVRISMTVDSGLSKVPRGSFMSTGRLLIQGSQSYSDQEAWIHHIRANPLLDTESLVEIPVSIHISEGEIGFRLNNPSDGNENFLTTSAGPRGIKKVDSVFFPLSVAGLSAKEGKTLRDSPKLIDQYLTVFASVPHSSLTLKSTCIFDGYGQPVSSTPGLDCGLLDVSLSNPWEHPTDDQEEAAAVASLGEVRLSYGFPGATRRDSGDASSPVFCQIAIETEPDTGMHMLPIVLYSGDVVATDFKSVIFDNDDPTSPLIPPSQGRVRSGYGEISKWMRGSPGGYSFASFLDNASESINEAHSSWQSRFHAILGDRGEAIASVQPVLLAAGTINAGETEIFPLFLENSNPVPITVSLSGTRIDGFGIQLGRDKIVASGEGKSLSEVITRTWTITKKSLGQNATIESADRIRGQRLESLFHFLETSSIPRSFLDEFHYRDAIYADHGTVELYRRSGLRATSALTARFHKTSLPTLNSSALCCEGQSTDEFGRDIFGPGLLSVATGKFEKLCYCASAESPSVTIPPAGIARLEVTVTAPFEDMLEQDFNSFIATGLFMSTNHGVEIPVLVSFDVPRGNIILSGFSKDSIKADKDAPQVFSLDAVGAYFKSYALSATSGIVVPSRSKSQFRFESLLGQEGLSLDAQSEEFGQAVYARSTFNRDLQVVKIESCNSWFQIDLSHAGNESKVDAFLGVNIGSLRFQVPCSNPNTMSHFNSFHGCVLKWISKWQELQKRGCGKHGVEKNAAGVLQGRHRRALTKAHSGMLNLSAWSFTGHRGLFVNGTGHFTSDRYFDGYLAPSLVTLAADIWNWWRRVHKWDLFTMSTDLRVTVMWNSSDNGPIQNVSIPLQNVTVISKLIPPSLVDGDRIEVEQPSVVFGASTLEFPSTLVGAPVGMTIPLYNPTGVAVRVRLATVLPEEVEDDVFYVDRDIRNEFISSDQPPYVQGPLYAELGLDQMNQQWWDGPGSFFFSDFNGNLIRAHHNVSVRAGSHAYVGLVSPSLLSNSALLYGCAERCGIRDEQGKNDATRKTQHKTLIGAAAATGAVLAGRVRGESAEDNAPVEPFDDLSFFAGSSIHADGLGPTAFGIPRSALGEIVIEPHSTAEIGPVYFRPPGRFPRMGIREEAESCLSGETFETLIFLENSLTGVERVALKGKALLERVEFSDLSGEEDETFSDIELRNGMMTLLFPGTLLPPFPTNSRVVKEIILKNTGDTPVSFQQAYLFDGITPRESKFTNRSCDVANFQLLNCSLDGTFLPFRIDPGEPVSFFVSHKPKCTQKYDFITLKVDYDTDAEVNSVEDHPHTNDPSWRARRANQRRSSFRSVSETLVIGYDMSEEIFSHCVSSNTELFLVSTESPPLLTPLNQTLGLRRLAKSVKPVHTRSPVPDVLFFFYYLCFCLIVISTAVYEFRSRRGASTLLQDYSRRNFVVQNGLQRLGSLLQVSAREATQAEFDLIGQEHVRRAMVLQPSGRFAPQCVTQTGSFHRDRSRILPSQPSLVVPRDRTRTISEALFQGIAKDQLHDGLVPLNVGWRAAAARGIISERSFRKFQGNLRTHRLLVLRSRHPQRAAAQTLTVKHEQCVEQSDANAERTGGILLRPNNEIGSESPNVELASEASDIKITGSEMSPTGKSDHQSADISRQTTDSPGLKSIDFENGTAQDAALDSGFKTIRGEKSGKGRKKPSQVSKGQNGSSSKKERAPRQTTKKSVVEDKSTGSSEAYPVSNPANHHISSTDDPRGWAHIAAPSQGYSLSEKSSSVRPPPGLGPPPGFASHHPVSPDILPSPPQQDEVFALDFPGGLGEMRQFESHYQSSAHSETSSNSGDHAQLSSSPVVSSSYLSRDNSVDQLPPFGMFLGDTLPDGADEQPEAKDFDVLDFLDGILNDGSNNDIAGEAPAEVFPPSITAPESATQVESLVDPVVPANPWADDGGATATSRASLYGISLNETIAARETVGFPLLTPQLILEGGTEEDEETRRSPLFVLIQKQNEEED